MTREDLEILERGLMKLVVRLRQLGGYDAHAENEAILSEALFNVVRHLREKSPRVRKKDDSDE